MQISLFSIILALVAAQFAIAQDSIPSGPAVGETIPAFSLPDQRGNLQDLDSITGPRGAVILFHRSADW
jgi:hypothetical protein